MNKCNLNESVFKKILFFTNPRLKMTNSHYVCGSDLIVFSSIVSIENCLTELTTKCKCLIQNSNSHKIYDEN